MDKKKVGMVEKIGLIRAKWPPLDSMQAFHPSSRQSTFSITGYQSCIEARPADNSMPTYLMGRDSRGVASIAELRIASSFDIPKVTSVDLSRLRQRPKKIEKMSSIANTSFAAFKVPSSRNIVSLAY